MPSLSLITLDLDETLWPISPTLEQAEECVYRWLRLHAPRVTLLYNAASIMQRHNDVRRRFAHLAHDVTAIRRQILVEVCVEAGYDGHCADAAMAVFLEARNKVYPFADALTFLNQTAGNYAIASLTNGNADVKKTACAPYIGFAHSAAAAGAAKPSPTMFLQALAWAKTKPEAAVHIGDDPEMDVMPAKRLGMYTIWINRNERLWPPDMPRPDLIVRRLDSEELCRWLRLS